jgi:hypothetical protein
MAPRSLLLLFVAYAVVSARADAQERLSAGVGFTAGILGAEAGWERLAGLIDFEFGAGVAGLGVRAILPLSDLEPSPDRPAVTRYLSVGYLLTPWSFGNIDATGAIGGEVGVRIEHGNGRLFADLAAGAAVPHGGTWGGNTLSPLLRLQVGVRRRAPGA